MISKINVNTNPNKSQQNSPSFKAGALDVLTWGLQQCNDKPMVGVSVIDFATAIIPRTYVDAKTNGFAAAETFRRESSGLVVNCLIPGFFVLGAAKVFEAFTKNHKELGLSGIWANENSFTKLHSVYKNTGSVDKYVDELAKGLSFNSGKVWNNVAKLTQDSQSADKVVAENAAKKLAKFNQAQQLWKDCIKGANGKGKKNLKEVEKLFLEAAGGAEHIRFNGKAFGTNLSTMLRDSLDCGKLFEKHFADTAKFESLVGKAAKFINRKSRWGLAIVIPLAASMQSINRWITRKSSGKEGAPIYKDFIQQDDKKKKHIKNPGAFMMEKIGAAGLMVGVALLSMMEKPSFKNILKMIQFNKILPSMNQCRWIATATFASRMLVSEDRNELREATIRDIATFCALYFFGDYVNKGVGSLIKKATKGKIDLLNYAKEEAKSSKLWDKFKYWVKDTSLKSFDEAGQISKKAKNLRSLCEISSLGFSMLLLGFLVPWYVRKQTEINHRKEVEQSYKNYHTYPTILPVNGTAKKAFQAFGMLEEQSN